MKKIIIALVVAIVIGGFVLSAAHLLANLEAGKYNHSLLYFALAQANKRLAGKVTSVSMEGNPLKTFTLNKIEVSGPDREILARVDEASLKLSLGSLLLLRPGFVIKISNAELNLIKDDQGWNWQKLRRPGSGQKRALMPRLGAAVSIANLKLEFRGPEQGTVYTGVLSLAGKFKLNKDTIFINISEAKGEMVSPKMELRDFSVDGKLAQGRKGWRVKIHSLTALTGDSRVELGTADYYTDGPRFQTQVNAFVVAPETLRLFWPGHPLKLPVKGSARVGSEAGVMKYSAAITSQAGGLDGEGKFIRERKTFDFKGRVKDFSPELLLGRKFPLRSMNAEIALQYRSAAKPFLPGLVPGETVSGLDAEVSLDSFKSQSVKSFPAKIRFQLKGEDYTGVVLSESPGANFSADIKGAAGAPYKLSLKAAFKDLDAAALGQGLPGSRLNGELDLAGQGKSFDSFKGRGGLRIQPSSFKDINIEQAPVSYEISGGRISFELTAGEIESVRVSGKGWVKPAEKDLPFNIKLQGVIPDSIFAQKITKGFLQIDQGAFSCRLSGGREKWSAQIDMDAAKPRSSWFLASAAEFSADLSGRSFDRISGNARLKAKSFQVPKAEYKNLKLDPFDLEVKAAIPGSSPGQPTVDFDLDTPGSGPDFAAKAQARVRADLKSRDYQISLNTLKLKLLGEDWKLMRPTRAGFKKSGMEINNFEMAGKDSRLKLDGTVSKNTVNLNLAWEKLELDAWLSRLLEDRSGRGRTSGKLLFSGPAGLPELHGEIRLQDAQYRQAKLQNAEASLNCKNSRCKFELTGKNEGAGKIIVSGTAPVLLSFSPAQAKILKDQKMDIEVKADKVSSSMITSYWPGLRDEGGVITLLAYIRGTPGDPVISGRAGLQDLKLTILQFGAKLEGLSGEIILDNNKITVPSLSGRSNQGTIEFGGGSMIAGRTLKEMDFSVKAANFKVLDTPDMSAVVDAAVKIIGDSKGPKINGEVKFLALNYRPPPFISAKVPVWEKEDNTVTIKGAKAPKKEKGGQSDWLKDSDIEFKFDVPGTGQVRNSEMNMRVSGEMNLTKKPRELFLFNGKVESKEGFVVFQGKPFIIEKGTLRFPAIPVIDPKIEILATYRVSNYKTHLKIGGTFSKPTLDVYSEPPLDQADVLAVILFGKPTNSLTEGQKQSLGSTGGQLVAGYAASGLANSLSQALNLDFVIIQPGQDLASTGIGVGKYLNEKLYVFYYQQFGVEASREFKVRYDLMKNVSIEAGQDKTGQGGVDVYFTYPY